MKISKTLFRILAIKCRWGGSQPKFLMCRSFFIESLSKKNFAVGDPKNRRFWAFFQKSMSEISAKWEKTCFSCCRFFRKIEEMGVYFGGCALMFFSQKLINIARFLCKNQGDRARTCKVIEHPMSVFFWGSTVDRQDFVLRINERSVALPTHLKLSRTALRMYFGLVFASEESHKVCRITMKIIKSFENNC